MNKFFRITLAEIKKIVLKPTFYILVGCLFVAVIVASFLFAPATRPTYTSLVQGDNIARLYNNFNREISPVEDGRVWSNNLLQEKFDQAQKFNDKDELSLLQSRVCVIFRSYFYQLDDAIKNVNYNTSHLINIYQSSGELLQYLDNLEVSTTPTNFMMKTQDFRSLKNLLLSLRSTLPSTREDIEALDGNREELSVLCRSIWDGFKPQVDWAVSTCQNLAKVTFDEQFLQQIASLRSSALNYLHRQEVDITLFYQDNQDSINVVSKILAYKEMLDDYKAGTQVTLLALDNIIDLKRFEFAGGNISDYMGFDDVSIYKLNEETTFYNYIIKNQIAYSKALTGLNFQSNSGLKTNGYDFAYFLVCIAGFLLSLIFIYFAVVIFAGERNDGVMRMNLTKPVSRVKLYFAKLSALLALDFVAIIGLGLLFLAIGACIYGAPAGSVLVSIFSGTSATAIAPFGNFLLKLVSLFVENAFYIVLTCFVSVLCANPIFSVVVSYLVYAFALTTNTLLSKLAFLKFLPFVHTDLSTFFGGGIWGNNFLASLVYNGASFALSFVYLMIMFAILTVASCFAFKKQEL